MKSIGYGISIFWVCLCCLALPPAHANGVVIKDGGTVIIDGGTLVMNCQTITVKSGGTLTLIAGKIDRCCRIEVETGGTFTQVGGVVLRWLGFLPGVYELLLLSQ